MGDGTLNLQGTWDSHQLFEFGPNGLNIDSIGRKGSNFIEFPTTTTAGLVRCPTSTRSSPTNGR